ncbi:MAG TPA: iron-sulfur cluster repair di-iron protein [Candidatus Sulfotelmatobacter sp.]|nr:iron-sulfur cluster repair di-iron protein [Candidatus Sulfotelmatobacter sp.]
MSVSTAKTVREVAVEFPEATRIFERFGIDYCCGGNQSLEEACAASNLSVDQVLDSLELAEQTARAKQTDRNWQTEPLADLVAHITSTHHKYTREEIARLRPLFDKVYSVHGKNHPELQQVRASFQEVAQELTPHMMKEEMMLFPYIVRMEEAVIQKEPILPPPFGTVQNPVAMMMHEHDSAGAALQAMHQASAGYTPPGDACISYQTLYTALAAFETDLHQHIHLENNILFPRAIEMEQKH